MTSRQTADSVRKAGRMNGTRGVGAFVLVIASLMGLLVVMSIGEAGIQEWSWMLFGAVGMLALGMLLWTLGSMEFYLRQIRDDVEEFIDAQRDEAVL